MVLLLAVKALQWPDVRALAGSDPESTAFIDRYERRTGEQVAWQPVGYGAIANSLKRAVLVAEDINFFEHDGFEREELERAVRETVFEGKRLRGASTLTQQLAKNLWLSPSRNPLRKLDELLLTRQLERHLEKRKILELYLNVVEFGPGVFGAEAAAQRFFGKSATQLNNAEAAQLAASLPHSKWSPQSESKSYRAHVNRIARRMEKARWIEGAL